MDYTCEPKGDMTQKPHERYIFNILASNEILGTTMSQTQCSRLAIARRDNVFSHSQTVQSRVNTRTFRTCDGDDKVAQDKNPTGGAHLERP